MRATAALLRALTLRRSRRKIPEHVRQEFEDEIKWDDNIADTYKKHVERVRSERESIERAMRKVAQTEDNEGKLLDDLETQAKDRLEHMRKEATDREQAANQAEVDQGDTNEFVIGIDDDDELGIVPGLGDDGGQFKRRGDVLGGSSKRVHFGGASRVCLRACASAYVCRVRAGSRPSDARHDHVLPTTIDAQGAAR